MKTLYKKSFVLIPIAVVAIVLLAVIYVRAFQNNVEINDTDYNRVVASYAEKHGYSINDYPERLINLLEKEPESREFVLDYPKNAGHKRMVNLGKIDYDKVPLFIQWDTRWGYAPYGNGIVGLDGCGPTCLSMAAVYLLHDSSMTPDYIADFSAENLCYQDGVGTMWTLFTEGAQKLGLNAEELPLDRQAMLDALDSGRIIICSVGAGDFTEKGHFILLRGYESEGFYVNDPNSYRNSEKIWSYSRLAPQIKNMWAISKE